MREICYSDGVDNKSNKNNEAAHAQRRTQAHARAR